MELTIPAGGCHDLVLELSEQTLPERPPEPGEAWQRPNTPGGPASRSSPAPSPQGHQGRLRGPARAHQLWRRHGRRGDDEPASSPCRTRRLGDRYLAHHRATLEVGGARICPKSLFTVFQQVLKVTRRACNLRRSSARPRAPDQADRDRPPPDAAALAAARPGGRISLTTKGDSPHLTVQVRHGELPGC